MAIGALPVGMYALGEAAEWLGASNAIILSAALGGVVLAAWARRRPEIVALTS